MIKTDVEEIYDTAFKDATSRGATKRVAHMAGLEAIYETGKKKVKTHPFREQLSRCLKDVAKKLAP